MLLPSEYGYFSVAYAILLLAGTFHTAFLTEPMLVFGPGRYRNHFLEYLGALVRWHWSLTGLISVLFVAAGLVLLLFGSKTEMAWTLGAMGLATAPVLLQWLFRRSCYVLLQPRYAVEAGFVYFVTVIGGLLGLHSRGLLVAGTAFLLLATGSLAAAAWIFWRLTGNPAVSGDGGFQIRDASMAHLEYGRWAAGTALLSWVPGNIYYLLLPLLTSVEDVAGLRALLNLIMPVLHVIAALGLLLLPALVRAIKSSSGISRIVSRVTMLFIAATVAYGIFLAVAGDWLIGFLYDGKYDSFYHLLLPLSILPASSALVAVFGSVIRAYERPDLVFRAYLGTLFVTATIGLALVYYLGVDGAAFGLLLSSTATALFMGLLLRRSRSGARVIQSGADGSEQKRAD
ncbi:MAG: hypothetical protein JJ992_15195 [Planctomycetes bacterium]|nr:hypothetical protein [Planctomycetota bacterium]